MEHHGGRNIFSLSRSLDLIVFVSIFREREKEMIVYLLDMFNVISLVELYVSFSVLDVRGCVVVVSIE